MNPLPSLLSAILATQAVFADDPAGTSPPVRVVEVALNYASVCVLLGGGTLRCWSAEGGSGGALRATWTRTGVKGVRSTGASICLVDGTGAWCGKDLGKGEPDLTAIPEGFVADHLSSPVREIASCDGGQPNGCATDESGATACWGEAAVGQRLQASFDSLALPSRPAPPLGAIRLAVGTEHACGLWADGGVYCWGAGGWGGGAYDNDAPPHLVPGLPPAAVIDADVDGTCALDREGTVWCWGCGVPFGETCGAAPVKKPLPDGRAVSVDVGSRHACALSENGNVWCWGDATEGQFAAEGGSSKIPRLVEGFPEEATHIAASADGTCALMEGGALYCWGGVFRETASPASSLCFIDRLEVPPPHQDDR